MLDSSMENNKKKSYHSIFVRNESYNIFSKELEKSLEKLNPLVHKIISVNHSISSTEYTALIIYESEDI
jgi:predicted RND superfamily exporter protein